MRLCPIQEKLVPPLEDLPQSHVFDALRPIREDFVSNHILPHARFHSGVIVRVLAFKGVPLDRPVPSFRNDHHLRAALDVPLDQIVLSLGLSWNANLLCQYALRPTLRLGPVLNGIAMDEVRFALEMRAHAPAFDASLEKDQTKIRADGLACLLAGLRETPEELRVLIAYRLSLMGLDPTPSDRSAAPSRHFFGLWCAHRFEALSTDTKDAA